MKLRARNKSEKKAFEMGFYYVGKCGKASESRLYRKDSIHGIMWLQIPPRNIHVELYTWKFVFRLGRREFIRHGKEWEYKLIDLMGFDPKEKI